MHTVKCVCLWLCFTNVVYQFNFSQCHSQLTLGRSTKCSVYCNPFHQQRKDFKSATGCAIFPLDAGQVTPGSNYVWKTVRYVKRLCESICSVMRARLLPLGLLNWFLCARRVNPSQKTVGGNLKRLPVGCASPVSSPECYSAPPNVAALSLNLQFSVWEKRCMHIHCLITPNMQRCDHVCHRVNRLILGV